MDLISKIELRAKELGFDLFGVADPNIEKEQVDFFQKWLDEGRAGSMEAWLKRGAQKRADINKVSEGAKSAICLAVNYYPGDHVLPKRKVARYAWGNDYHELIGDKARAFCEYLKELGDKNPVWYTDTGAIFERYLAYGAGLGFIGKNTCLITKEFGSWVFLAVILTKFELPFTGSKYDFSMCGSCKRCVEACPTGALSELDLDARKCISYLTIEKKGAFSEEERALVAKQNYCFGCDVCQEICPHNARAKKTSAFKPRFENLEMDDIAMIDKRSPVLRAKLRGLCRNLEALGS
ncbi:MAG: hypothetical protein ACD_65C00326G0004 [uncultured bacterium]|nr:MAG: hypothetical protein ACD_65C00326G0004 [uncultured bacterium]KKT01949.1 MAG: hypothetical protein UV80_C0007G0063 [Candidatus Peregrinibacteria bacterium GW2011_GWF2_43_17]